MRPIIPEPADYAQLRTFEIVAPYRIALFTDRQTRIFCPPRVGVNRGVIELRLRTIEGSLTCRLSLGDVAAERGTKSKTQVTSTVTRLLTTRFGPSDKTLISLEGTCALRSLWWVPRDDATVVSRVTRAHDFGSEDGRVRVEQTMRSLGAKPFKLSRHLAANVLHNDQIKEQHG